MCMQLGGGLVDLLRCRSDFFVARCQIPQTIIDIERNLAQLLDIFCDELEHRADLRLVAIAFACRRLRGLAERTHLIGNDRKSLTGRARARRLNRSVQRKQMGVAGDPLDAIVVLLQRMQQAVDLIDYIGHFGRAFDHLLHGFIDADAFVCRVGVLLGHAGDRTGQHIELSVGILHHLADQAVLFEDVLGNALHFFPYPSRPYA